MTNDSTKEFAHAFLTGFFDRVSTLLKGETAFEILEISQTHAPSVDDKAGKFGAAVCASSADLGALAVCLPAKDVYTMAGASLNREIEPGDLIVPEDAVTFREVFDPCLEAGLGFLKKKHRRELALEEFQIIGKGLAELPWNGPVALAEFTYSLPLDLHGSGMVLVSGKLVEVLLPASSRPLDRAEVNEILASVGMQEAPGARDSAATPSAVPPNLDMVLDIELTVKARLGRVEMPISEILALGPGSIVEVGHLVDEPIELLVNDRLIARGDVIVVDEKFGLRITEIISPKERIESLR